MSTAAGRQAVVSALSRRMASLEAARATYKTLSQFTKRGTDRHSKSSCGPMALSGMDVFPGGNHITVIIELYLP